MRVRPAAADDLGALHAVERACFGAAAWSADSLRDELAGVPVTRHVLVAEEPDGAGVLGYAALMVAGDVADVQRIAVLPDHRDRGHGRVLLDALVQEAARRGCARVLLEVEGSNAAALALYASAGFARLSRRVGYYGAGRDALVLERAAPTST